MTDFAIHLKGITKRYGQRTALRHLDLAIPSGSIYALLGPNGAGKTTLLRCLTGLMRPEEGEGTVLGEVLGPRYPSAAWKARVGYVAQPPALYEWMTARELFALARGLHPKWDEAMVSRYSDLFALPLDLKVKHMSLGVRAQLGLALAMGGNPDLLLLDEPTLGLDPANRHRYLQVLLEDSLESGRTVLFSSHDLHQIERLAEQVLILRDGEAVVSGAIDDLKLTEKRARVVGDLTEAALLAVPGVWRAVPERSGWLVMARGDANSLRDRFLAVPGVTAAHVYDQSLEEIFLSYVS